MQPLEKRIKKEYTNKLVNPQEFKWSCEEFCWVVAKINDTNENRQMKINFFLQSHFKRQINTI